MLLGGAHIKQEKERVIRAQKDPQAFGELYEQNYSLIFGYVLRRVANVQIAEDITSTTFFKALDKIGQFRWQNIRFSAWLYRIAGNEISNYFRQNGHHTVLMETIAQSQNPAQSSSDSEITDAEEQLDRHKKFLRLHGMILLLPLKYQEVITLRYFEEKTTNEIADILGKREGTVRSLLSRGLEKLRSSVR